MLASTATPSDRLTLRFPGLFPSQRLVASSPARFKVLAAGRRWRKTSLGVLLCLQTALRGGRTWYVAPTYPIASIGWQALRRLARQIPGATPREFDRFVSFPGGGEVQVRSAEDPDSLRGFGLDGVAVDEAAYVKEVAWTESLRPALADRQGWALFSSTPNGYNWFHRLFQEAPKLQRWARWQFPTWDNPHVPEDEIELNRQQMHPVIFAQEFGAEFVELAGLKPFSAEWITYWDDTHDKPPEDLYVCIGVDPAISTKDEASTTAIVAVGQARRGPDRVTAFVLKAIQGHWTPYEQANRIIHMCAELQPRRLRIEDVGWQRALGDIVKKEAQLQGVRLPFIEEVRPETDKLRRALGASPMVESGRVLFGPGQRDLVDALLSVPHDRAGWDFTDAFGLALGGLPKTRAEATPLEAPEHSEASRKRARSYAIPGPKDPTRPIPIRPGMGFPLLPGSGGKEEAVRRSKRVGGSYGSPFRRRER